jgi:hypothetical protein
MVVSDSEDDVATACVPSVSTNPLLHLLTVALLPRQNLRNDFHVTGRLLEREMQKFECKN